MSEMKPPIQFQDHLKKKTAEAPQQTPLDFTEAALDSLMGGEADEFAVFMSLPDDEFEVLAPIVYGHLVDMLSAPGAKIALAESINDQEFTATELLDGIEQAKIAFQTKYEGEWSKQKIDFLVNLLGVIGNHMVEALGENIKPIVVQIQKLNPDARIPEYANIGDAGVDLYALEDYDIAPGETKLIPTGLAVAIPRGYEIQIRPKSGRALKTKLRVANTPGTIDSGYRDEVKVIIENVEAPIQSIETEPVTDENGNVKSLNVLNIEYGKTFHIGKGDKFAQMVLCANPKIHFYEVDKLPEEGDRGGGFGSSGLQ